MESKYYAYYKPNYKVDLMNDIKNQLLEEYDSLIVTKLMSQIFNNINNNDTDEYLCYNKYNSLILIKFSLVNHIFIKQNNIDKNNYTLVSKSVDWVGKKTKNNNYNQHYTCDKYSSYFDSHRSILFNGSTNNPHIDDNTQYIFTEYLLIDIATILKTYKNIKFDTQKSYTNNKSQFLKSLLKYEQFNSTDNTNTNSNSNSNRKGANTAAGASTPGSITSTPNTKAVVGARKNWSSVRKYPSDSGNGIGSSTASNSAFMTSNGSNDQHNHSSASTSISLSSDLSIISSAHHGWDVARAIAGVAGATDNTDNINGTVIADTIDTNPSTNSIKNINSTNPNPVYVDNPAIEEIQTREIRETRDMSMETATSTATEAQTFAQQQEYMRIFRGAYVKVRYYVNMLFRIVNM